jgi:nicotinamidase-related amidase
MDDVPRFEFSSLFDPETAGLLVVDVQEKLWPFIHDTDAILKRISQMIRVCGRLGLPILVTEQYVKGLGESIPLVKEALGRFEAYHPIEKQAFSCFGEPRFVDALERSEVQTLALVGIEAHVCVMQTALDAIDRGVDVFFVAEATGSRDPRHKAEAIDRVRDAGAIVGSVEMFAFEALRGSDHPKFKEVQKVIL